MRGKLTPDLNVDIGDRLAGLRVKNEDVHLQVDTLLVLNQILTDELSGDVVRTLSDLWAQNAAAVRGEDGAGRSVKSPGVVGLVRGVNRGSTAYVIISFISSVRLLLVCAKREQTHQQDHASSSASKRSRCGGRPDGPPNRCA